MKRYLLQCLIREAGGTQTFYVDAKSEADALAMHARGESDIYLSECEVLSISEPELIGDTALDDYGDSTPEAASGKDAEDAKRYRLLEELFSNGKRSPELEQFFALVREQPDTPEGFRTAIDRAMVGRSRATTEAEPLAVGTLKCPADKANLHFKIFQGMRIREGNLYAARCPHCKNYYGVEAPKD